MNKNTHKHIVYKQLHVIVDYLKTIKEDEPVNFEQVVSFCKAYEAILKEYIKAGFESSTRMYLTGTLSILSWAINRALQKNQGELYARIQGGISNIVRYLQEQDSVESTVIDKSQ